MRVRRHFVPWTTERVGRNAEWNFARSRNRLECIFMELRGLQGDCCWTDCFAREDAVKRPGGKRRIRKRRKFVTKDNSSTRRSLVHHFSFRWFYGYWEFGAGDEVERVCAQRRKWIRIRFSQFVHARTYPLHAHIILCRERETWFLKPSSEPNILTLLRRDMTLYMRCLHIVDIDISTNVLKDYYA